MNKTTDQGEKKTLTLSKKLDLKKSAEAGQVRQSFAHGRSKTVAVEVKRKRVVPANEKAEDIGEETVAAEDQDLSKDAAQKKLKGELGTRLKVLQEALKAEAEETEERARRQAEIEMHERELAELEKQFPVEEAEQKEPKDAAETKVSPEAEVGGRSSLIRENANRIMPKPGGGRPQSFDSDEDEEESRRKSGTRHDAKRPGSPARREAAQPRKLSRHTITQVLAGGEEERMRSMAALRRSRQKEKSKLAQQDGEAIKVVRDVIIPDTISVQELANRMAVRGADVIKSLMKLGMMVTINQVIDADTAELVVGEFGHKVKRVSESDIEIGLKGTEDNPAQLQPRAPVVTIMGHVDHGKTSLLDALRQTDVASHEAGGITQHIGAYQVTIKSGQKITFIDTPGHAAFTEMRARGANVTDVVVLVVAADDGIMEQTIEAINHAKAANVPMVVAINKIDKPDANPERVRSDLLQHGLVVESLGGDILTVEVSARNRLNLDKLEEAILLQAEILDLKANPKRAAEGVVVEAQIDKGRGTVATVLVQRGTLKIGDILVAGTEWGRVRALINDHGEKVEHAVPSQPVSVLGFNGIPAAGDEFFVVEDESKAREVAEFRVRRHKDAKAAASARGTMEQMLTQISTDQARELAVVIKSDVQGSLEAITTSLAKLATNEVNVRVLHGAVGGINESDVTLARASKGIIIGFNVRANPQARDMARRDGIEIRYYSIIYDVIDDAKAFMSGLLSPTLRETFLGTAEIREVFNITKVGKIAGCYVTEGVVKRGAKVRLLRDNVVIHEGLLKTLKRFKDEVKEVKESYECGMAFENYNDIRQGDMIECFDVESIARQL